MKKIGAGALLFLAAISLTSCKTPTDSSINSALSISSTANNNSLVPSSPNTTSSSVTSTSA